MPHSLTLEIHHNTEGWLEAAKLNFINTREVELEYDLDYAVEYLGRKDRYALSLHFPVSTQPYRGPIPGFIIDLLPQGEPLRHLLNRYQIHNSEDYKGILTKAPLASPGNIRIREPWEQLEQARPKYQHPGFTRQDVVQRNVDFIEYMEKIVAPFGGTSGAAGGSPKFLLREDESGRLHAEGLLDDKKTTQAYLIKLPFTDSSNSLQILQVEKLYYDLLCELPVRTGKELSIDQNVLFIPRFDRIKELSGVLNYHGLESLYSAHNINVHGARLRHEDNIELINRYSTKAHDDILEYIKRDILNKILANSDNHGRNTSFIKMENEVRLSPLYDVTAMRFFAGDFIVELTRWDQDKRSLDAQVQWVCHQFQISQLMLKSSLQELLDGLSNIESKLVNLGVPEDFLERSKLERKATISELQKFCLGS